MMKNILNDVDMVLPLPLRVLKGLLSQPLISLKNDTS